MLEIRKKGYKNFLYVSGDFKPYTASDLVILFNGVTGFLRSESGRVIFEKEGWNFLDIKVYDDTTGGTEESFSSVINLTQRLIDLGCPAYYSDDDIVISNFVSVEDNNALTIGEDGLLYVSVVSTGSDPLKTDRGGYTGTSQELADLIQDNTDAQNNYKSFKNVGLTDLTDGGGYYVPTAGAKTTRQEVADFLNLETFTVDNEELTILKVVTTEFVNDIPYLYYTHYNFTKNNISGTWGSLDALSPWRIEPYYLILDSSELISPSNSTNTITIDLGDILTDDIVTYLNSNAQPTSGQTWELLSGNSYFFVYTSNGSAITDFYKGQKPVILGTTGNYTVVSTDFQRISTDGVTDSTINNKADKPISTANTGSTVELADISNYSNYTTANTSTLIDVSVGSTVGQVAIIRSNTSTEPQIRVSTSPDVFATKLKGSDFIPSTDMDIYIRNNGVNIEYFLDQLEEGDNKSYISGSLGLGNNTPNSPTTLKFNEIYSDNGTITHDNTIGKFTVQKQGVYSIIFNGYNASSATSVFIGRNTLTPSASSNLNRTYNASATMSITVSATVELESDDYVVFYLSSGSLVNTDANRSGTFSIIKIS